MSAEISILSKVRYLFFLSKHQIFGHFEPFYLYIQIIVAKIFIKFPEFTRITVFPDSIKKSDQSLIIIILLNKYQFTFWTPDIKFYQRRLSIRVIKTHFHTNYTLNVQCYQKEMRKKVANRSPAVINGSVSRELIKFISIFRRNYNFFVDYRIFNQTI